MKLAASPFHAHETSCVPVSCPNVEVKDDHTYFVEDGSGLQTPVWVHNSCNDDETVDQVLRRKRGNIKNAPLKRGSPSWEEIRYMKMGEIKRRAQQGEKGYRTILKLLMDPRFNK